MTADRMSLAEAHDALSDQARLFHNEMIRRGVKEMSAEEWMEEFRSWLPHGREFAFHYAATLKFLEECERRAASLEERLPKEEKTE
jgi:hypothetical protein